MATARNLEQKITIEVRDLGCLTTEADNHETKDFGGEEKVHFTKSIDSSRKWLYVTQAWH